MKIILMIVVGIYLAWKILHIISYKLKIVMTTDNYAKMKWKTIKRLYPINPNKWSYNYFDDHVWGNNHDEEVLRILFYENIPIMLTTIDFIRFRIAYKIFAHKYGNNKEKHKAIQYILEDVQQDINRQKQQAQKEIDSAIKEMKRLAKQNEDLD